GTARTVRGLQPEPPDRPDRDRGLREPEGGIRGRDLLEGSVGDAALDPIRTDALLIVCPGTDTNTDAVVARGQTPGEHRDRSGQDGGAARDTRRPVVQVHAVDERTVTQAAH